MLSFVAILLYSSFSIFWLLTRTEDIERTSDLALEWKCWLRVFWLPQSYEVGIFVRFCSFLLWRFIALFALLPCLALLKQAIGVSLLGFALENG